MQFESTTVTVTAHNGKGFERPLRLVTEGEHKGRFCVTKAGSGVLVECTGPSTASADLRLPRIPQEFSRPATAEDLGQVAGNRAAADQAAFDREMERRGADGELDTVIPPAILRSTDEDDAEDTIRAALGAHVMVDIHASHAVGGDLDALVQEGGKMLLELQALPEAGYGEDGDPVSVLDNLVQDCADKGREPGVAQYINNAGYSAQVSYLLAYNGTSGIEVIREALDGILPAPSAPAP